MRHVCLDRDRLWGKYDAALRDYTESVRDAGAGNESWGSAQDARLAVDNLRTEIIRHCQEHGCDPGYLRQNS